MITLILEFLSVLIVGLMAGSTFYSSFVEIPIRATTDEESQLMNWRLVFPKASGLLKSIGMITVPILILTWYLTSNIYWIFAAIPLFLLLPFTAIAIAKTNTKLLELKNSKGAKELIYGWDKLHHIRTIMAICSFAGCILAILLK